MLLIFRDDDRDFRMLQHENELCRDRILIDRHGNTAQALRCKLRRIEAWPVITDDR